MATVVCVLLALHCAVFFLTPLSLSPDEAQYWTWSKRPDFAYYSKGPLIAALIASGTKLLGDNVYGVRLWALVSWCATLAAIGLFISTRYSTTIALCTLAALSVTPLFVHTGLVMTTDAPAVLCWLLTLVALTKVLEGRSSCWVIVGLAFGFGVWAKYTVLLLLPALLYVAWSTAVRRDSVRWMCAGALLAVSLTTPLVYWNAANGWVNSLHNVGHLRPRTLLSLRYLPELVGSQLGVIGPLMLPLAAMCLWQARGILWRDPKLRLFLLSAAPLAFVVLCLSLGRRVYVNWPLPLYLGLIFALAHLAHHHPTVIAPLRRLFVPGVLLNGAVTFAGYGLFVGMTYGLPLAMLPTKKLMGWDTLGTRIAHEERILAARGFAPQFYVTDSYEVAAEISFERGPGALVICDRTDERRMNQFDIWQQAFDWRQLHGKDALIVVKQPEDAERLQLTFESIEPLPPTLYIGANDNPLRSFHLFYGKGYRSGVPTPIDKY